MTAGTSSAQRGAAKRVLSGLVLSLTVVLVSVGGGVSKADEPVGPPPEARSNPQAPADRNDQASAPELRSLPDGRLQLGSLVIDRGRRELRIPARVNMTSGAIEVLACASWGKTHESLLVVEEEPYLIQIGLLLLLDLPPDATRSRPLPERVDTYQPVGPPLDILVVVADGEEHAGHSVLIENWICLGDDGATISPGPWVFTGSILDEGGFAAQSGGTVIATYVDPYAIVDNPRDEANDDESYQICAGRVPPAGTKLTLILAARGTDDGRRVPAGGEE